MFYIFGKNADSKNQGKSPYWYSHNGRTQLGGGSLPIPTSTQYGLVWPELVKRAQNNCGVSEFSYSFIRDGTTGSNNEIMSSVGYTGEWLEIKYIDLKDVAVPYMNIDMPPVQKFAFNEILVSSSGQRWTPPANGASCDAQVYTTGGDFVANLSGTGMPGEHKYPNISFVDQKYGMVLMGQSYRAGGETSKRGVAQLFTTGGELIQTYTGNLDSNGNNYSWPGNGVILDQDHIAIGAPGYDWLPGGTLTKTCGQVQIYRTGSSQVVKTFTGHNTAMADQHARKNAWFGVSLASTNNSIMVTSSPRRYENNIHAEYPGMGIYKFLETGGFVEFFDLSGEYGSSWFPTSPSYYYAGQHIASNDMNFYVVGGCDDAVTCNTSAFILSTGGTEVGTLDRTYGAVDYYSGSVLAEPPFPWYYLDASNSRVMQTRRLDSSIRAFSTGGMLQRSFSGNFPEYAGANEELTCASYRYSPFKMLMPNTAVQSITPKTGIQIWLPTGEVSFNEFVSETTGAFGEWSGLFSSVFTGMDLRFTNLGLEPQTNVTSSKTTPDYPLGTSIGDFRIGMQELDSRGGIAALSYLPGGDQGLTGNAGGDIQLDIDEAWRLDTSDPSLIPATRSIKYIMTQEIGYALGIGTNSDADSVMNPNVTNATTFGGKFPNGLSGSAVDKQGAMDVYGPITRAPWITQCTPISSNIALTITVIYEVRNWKGTWVTHKRKQKVNSSTMGKIIELIYSTTQIFSIANDPSKFTVRNLQVEDENGVIQNLAKEPYDPSTFPWAPGAAPERWDPVAPWPPYPTERVFTQNILGNDWWQLGAQFALPHFKYEGKKIVFA